MFTLTNNEDSGCRFAPCAAGLLLLKTRSATVKRAGLAQKVLLLNRWLENWPVLSNLHHSGFKRILMNTTILTRREVSRGETSGRETQQYNLITKGRNQRQIHE
jgi:hypothetical protein